MDSGPNMAKMPASQELEHDPALVKRFSHLKIDNRSNLSAIQNFALSILQNQKIAQYVRRVTLTYSHWASYPAEAFPYTATTDEERVKEKTFRAAIAEQKWDEPDATELLKRLMTTKSPGFNQRSSHQLLPDAVVAILLPILPNVEHWVVGEIHDPPFVGKAVQRAKNGIFGSISVKRLEICPEAPFSSAAWDGISWQAFEIYANLPQLAVMKSRGVGGIGIEDGGGYEVIPSKVSAVREIHLKHCEISGTCVSNIINFSTALEAFSYQFGGRSGDGGIIGWTSPKVAKALTLHRSTMRRMDIDVENQAHGSLQQEMEDWIEEMKWGEDTGEDKERNEACIRDPEDGNSDTETLTSEDSRKKTER
ncbi:hypothetical protein ONS96_003035 [Cadophora gregata f. sp. sojae]|nr:hypothetical protein ONS96_003035 [Cadophora gregata f. sp. sojae]